MENKVEIHYELASWNLKKIYQTDEEWEKNYQEFLNKSHLGWNEVNFLKGKLDEGTDKVEETLGAYFSNSRELEKPSVQRSVDKYPSPLLESAPRVRMSSLVVCVPWRLQERRVTPPCLRYPPLLRQVSRVLIAVRSGASWGLLNYQTA